MSVDSMDATPRRVSEPAEFGKVAVLLGGRSAEREISIIGGTAVLEALRSRGVDAAGVDAAEDVLTQLQQGAYDRVFIMLHGRGGEDGVIQGALETIGMAYTGSGVLGSALGLHKLHSKQLWAGAGIPTPAFVVLGADADLDQALEEVGTPLIVKPAREGSSLGMTRVDADEQLHQAWRTAREFDDCVLAEQWIEGKEYTVAILGRTPLPVIRLETPNAFYDYDAKYRADTTRYLCPCGLEASEEAALQALALRAFECLGASGWGRVDLMVDGDGGAWLIEINTVPGMTDHSLVPMAAQAAGMDFAELVWRILEGTMGRTGSGVH